MAKKRQLDILSHEFAQNVHEHFTRMRQEEPIYKARMGRRQTAYLITRYDDVTAAFKDSRLLKNNRNVKTESGKQSGMWLPKNFRPLLHNMLNTDEPDHRRLRNLVHKGFTPRMINNLEGRIEAIAHELIDEAQKQKQVDWIQSFALPLPITVICELIGIPQEDRQKFRRWTEKIVVNPKLINMPGAILGVNSFMKYTRKLADKRRSDPQDDLLTALAQAEEDGDQFTEDELLGMVFLLLVAGHETTVGLIANGTLALLSNPEQLELLRNDCSLMDSAVEELLRYDGPLQMAEMSFAREPITLHGVDIPQGSTVFNAILSANRDETVFDNADQLEITREPNRHLAFGHGIHYCLGAPLARLEAKVAFNVWLDRCPDMRLGIAPEQAEFINTMLVHRLKSLPVVLS